MDQLGELADRVGAKVQHAEIGAGVAALRHGEHEFHAAGTGGRGSREGGAGEGEAGEAGIGSGCDFFQRRSERADIGEAAFALGRHDHDVNGRSGFTRAASPPILIGKSDVRFAKMTREMELNFFAKFLADAAFFGRLTPDIWHETEMVILRAGVNRTCTKRRSLKVQESV